MYYTLYNMYHVPCIWYAPYHVPCIWYALYHVPCIWYAPYHVPCICSHSCGILAYILHVPQMQSNTDAAQCMHRFLYSTTGFELAGWLELRSSSQAGLMAGGKGCGRSNGHVASNGQYNVHEEHSRRLSLRSLSRVSDKVRFISHGLSRTVSNRPVCIQSLPRRQLAQLPTKMSCYSSILSHIHIHIY